MVRYPLFLQSLNEYDCLVLVDENAVFQVPPYSAREHDPLQVAPFAHHVLYRVTMGHAHHVLLDNRPFVQAGGDVVAGGSDQFHAALVGSMIRFGSYESGQKKSEGDTAET